MTDRTSRRGFLKLGGIGVAAAATTGLSGCSSLTGDGGGNGSSAALDVVPADVTSVAYADVGGMLEDEALGQLLNKLLELGSEEFAYTGPSTKEELLEQMEDQSNLDPTGLGESVAFGKAPETTTPTPGPSSQYAGTWFTADWSESDLIDAIEGSGSELEEGEYAGRPLYESTAEFDDSTVGVLSEGEYVVGPLEVTQDVIDVSEGNAESVGSELTDPYSNLRSGLFKAVSTVPDDALPGESVSEGGFEFDPQQIAKLQNGAVVGYHDGETLGLDSEMTAESADAASDLASVIDGAIVTAENSVESEDVSTALDAVEVESNGSTISIDYESDVESLSTLLDALVAEYKRIAGSGMGGRTQSVRATSFPIPISP